MFATPFGRRARYAFGDRAGTSSPAGQEVTEGGRFVDRDLLGQREHLSIEAAGVAW
jgi:hypothetical protein